MKRKTYAIKEIFESIQGEGYWTGKPSLFIRFAGCNLTCAFCDTDFSGGKAMTMDEVIDVVRDVLGIHPQPPDGEKPAYLLREDPHTVPTHIVLTGGEPGLQVDVDFIRNLRSFFGGYGIRVVIAIETNGTIPLPGVDWVTISPKDAFFGYEAALDEGTASVCNELKIVLDATCPFDETVVRAFRAIHIYLSPIMEKTKLDGSEQDVWFIPQETLQRCYYYLRRNPKWRLSLQTHKFIGAR